MREALFFETKKPAFLPGYVGFFAADSDFFVCGNRFDLFAAQYGGACQILRGVLH
jgi:hypothetical protein